MISRFKIISERDLLSYCVDKLTIVCVTKLSVSLCHIFQMSFRAANTNSKLEQRICIFTSIKLFDNNKSLDKS